MEALLPDDPAEVLAHLASLPAEPPDATTGMAASVGPTVIGFPGAGVFFDGAFPSGAAFIQGDFIVKSFWFFGTPPSSLPGHFHPITQGERHHDRQQGVVIRRTDGGAFSFQSITVSPLGVIIPVRVGSGLPDQSLTGYASFPTSGGANETVPITGFENVTEVWVTAGTAFSSGLQIWHSLTVGEAILPNDPPIADAGPDQIVECTSPAGASVLLDGSGSSDPDGSLVRFDWTEGATLVGQGEQTTVDFSIGSHTVTLEVEDDDGATDTDDVQIDIVDTTAPELSFDLLTTVLWPPNHSMHLVADDVGASDVCDPAPAVSVVVTSDEPVNGPGDGDTDVDWEVVDNGDGTFDVYVRAERAGNGDGRVYTISVDATDSQGNMESASAEVTVPHDMRGGRGGRP